MTGIPKSVGNLLNTIENHGFEAYLVGGCVRDILLGNEPKDWDITTNATPEQIQQIFLKTIETGIKHGTVTVLADDMDATSRCSAEVTTYRIDGEYHDNRRPHTVTFSQNLADDLARRDFTINAICLDKSGNITDLHGGQKDLAAKTIRCVGNPEKRFQEDALRILRALRFAATLGFSIEPATAQAIHANQHLLKNIAPERIREELTKLICSEKNEAVKAVLHEYKEVIGTVIPELAPTFGFNQQTPHHAYDVWGHTLEVLTLSPNNPISRWAALLHDSGKPHCFTVGEHDGHGHFKGHAGVGAEIANDVMRNLRFDNKTRNTVRRLIAAHMLPKKMQKPTIKKMLNEHGIENFERLLALCYADNRGKGVEDGYRLKKVLSCHTILREIIQNNECYSLKQLAVNGKDMHALGLRGKKIGETLHKLLESVIEERVPNTKEALVTSLAQQPEFLSPSYTFP